jgi:hypothetical protein
MDADVYGVVVVGTILGYGQLLERAIMVMGLCSTYEAQLFL